MGDMEGLTIILSAFFVLGLGCAALVFDFHGWRTRWIEADDADYELRRNRRIGILGFGWVGLLGSLYALLGAAIDLVLGRGFNGPTR